MRFDVQVYVVAGKDGGAILRIDAKSSGGEPIFQRKEISAGSTAHFWVSGGDLEIVEQPPKEAT